jgi:peroxiredoxin
MPTSPPKWFLAAAAALALAAGGCTSVPEWMTPGAPPGMENGSHAPGLSGTTIDGQPVSLAGLRGRVVTVFFFHVGCPYCRGQFETMDALAKRSASEAVAVVGVDGDDPPEVVRAAFAGAGVAFPVIVDADQAIHAAWGAAMHPTIYVVDREGVIRGHGMRGGYVVDRVDELLVR